MTCEPLAKMTALSSCLTSCLLTPVATGMAPPEFMTTLSCSVMSLVTSRRTTEASLPRPLS